MMSGKTVVNITAGSTTNKAEISVDRVAAKLDEKTQKAPFTIDAKGVTYTDKDISLQQLRFSYYLIHTQTCQITLLL